MNRAPRSANVVATRECYLLEIMRNVLDTLHNDPQYKERMDAVYRERVLEAHVRQLSLFGKLTDEEFGSLQEPSPRVSAQNSWSSANQRPAAGWALSTVSGPGLKASDHRAAGLLQRAASVS